MTEHAFTLISYRSNGAAWFRGECDARCDSEHEVQLTTDPVQVSRWWGQRLYQDFMRESPTREWELTLLVDGRERYDESFGNEIEALFETVEKDARTEFKRLKEEELERRRQADLAEQAEQERKAQASARAREALELSEYERLAKKYGPLA